MSQNSPDLDSLFHAALEIASADDRAAFIERSCGADHDLRHEVEKLLQSHERAGSFLNKPAPEFEGTILLKAASNSLANVLESGLARTFPDGAAVVIGSAGHSVLKSLGKTVGSVPRVLLRESAAEGPDPLVRPQSAEMPHRDPDSRYQLQGEIARGGMGAILKGRDTDLGRDLAIKVLLDAHKDKPEVIQRFIEEAQIGGQLQHPGIAPVYELGQFADRRPFFSMKLVKGETLSKLLADRETPTADRGKFLGIFEQVCQTMAYAHSRGVIHRDLKPANIMVGAFGEVQVMDWGLAKVLATGGVADEKKAYDKQKDASVIQTRRSVGSDSPGLFGSNTQMGSVMGTPAYMPPEQALGEIDQLDQRSDVFGLGAILAEILTGTPPYVGADGTQVFRMASRGKLEDCFARLDCCGADADLIAIAKHCLQAEPRERPADAGTLAARVAHYLESVETKLRETELERAAQSARAAAEAARAVAERQHALAEGQRAEAERQRAGAESRAAKRLRLVAASLALVTILCGVTAVQFQRIGRHQLELATRQNEDHATALVDSLQNAEIARVPSILEQMRGSREWVDPLVSARRHEIASDPLAQRRLALAFPQRDLDSLQDWLLTAHVDELPIVRDVLSEQQTPLVPALWQVALDSRQPAAARFRAACTLATFAPADAQWQQLAPYTADQLLEQPVVQVGKWADLLQPVHDRLLDRLAAAYRDAAGDRRPRRDKAAVVLATQFRDRPEILVDLLLDAEMDHFQVLLPVLENHRERAISLLEASLSETTQPAPVESDHGTETASRVREAAALKKMFVESPKLFSNRESRIFALASSREEWPVGGTDGNSRRKLRFAVTPPNDAWIEAVLLDRQHQAARLRQASRQANAAVALARLGETRQAWSLFRHTSRPDARTFVIHRLGPYGVAPRLIVDRLGLETDASIRRALILCLNEFPAEAIEPFRAALIQDLLARYRSDPDPGVHAAAGWVLYRWGQREQVFQVDRNLQGDAQAVAVEPGRRWYLRGYGETMVMLPPATFAIGNPSGDKTDSMCRIDRAFAIGSTLFRDGVRLKQTEENPIPEIDRWPMHNHSSTINWLAAANYCNELSRRDGIPEDQWCYERDANGSTTHGSGFNQKVKLAPDYLSRTGYRMPTEAEWEYACRAGALTSRYYGDADSLLDHYAWTRRNSVVDQPSRMATLKPNDFGLFDMLGNQNQFCLGRLGNILSAITDTAIKHPEHAGHTMWDTEMSNLEVSNISFITQHTPKFARYKMYRPDEAQLRTYSTIHPAQRGSNHNIPANRTDVTSRQIQDLILHGSTQGLRVVRTLPLDLCRSAFGEAHPATLGGLYSEAILAVHRGDENLVEELDRQLLERASAAAGQNAELSQTALRFAARLAARRGQTESARQRCTQLIEAGGIDLSLAELLIALPAGDSPANTERETQLAMARSFDDPWMKLAVACALVGKPNRSAEAISQGIDLAPDLPTKLDLVRQSAAFAGVVPALVLLRPDDPVVFLAHVRHLSASGQRQKAELACKKAPAIFESRLAQEPENSAWAGELADLLLEYERTEIDARWKVLQPSEMKSAGGATLTKLEDDSILVGGENPQTDQYTIALTIPAETEIRSIRLEALTHPSLPGNGPGRYQGRQGQYAGNFCLLSWTVTATSPDQNEPLTLAFDNACDDRRVVNSPITKSGEWNIWGSGEGRNGTAIWSVSNPVSLAAGTTLTFRMQFGGLGPENLGRFRLSVAGDPAAFEREQTRFAAMKIADPWFKLGMAYALTGDTERAATFFSKSADATSIPSLLELGSAIDGVLDALQTQHPEFFVTLASDLARSATERGRIEQARSLYTRLSKLQPEHRLWTERLEQLRPGVFAIWDFDAGLGSWGNANNCAIEVQDGVLTARTTGDDPFFSTAVSAPAGGQAVVLRYRSDEAFTLQIFWTDTTGGFDESRHLDASIPAAADEWREVTIPFSCQGALTALRLDPNTLPEHPLKIDSIRLRRLEPEDVETTSTNSDLLVAAAAALQSAGRTREALAYLARASAANPQDTILSLDVAALQAWFGQDQEYAATRRRILASAAGTGDATTADRAAKACSILPASDPAELAAVLALGRQAGELGNTDSMRAPCQTALGMAEYRNGNYEAADRALLAAVEAGPDNAHVMGIAPFYRAMSLYRQGKVDEARQLATETSVRIKALPADQLAKPLERASLHIIHNDLILWLAYKEAKDLIKFADAPVKSSP